MPAPEGLLETRDLLMFFLPPECSPCGFAGSRAALVAIRIMAGEVSFDEGIDGLQNEIRSECSSHREPLVKTTDIPCAHNQKFQL